MHAELISFGIAHGNGVRAAVIGDPGHRCPKFHEPCGLPFHPSTTASATRSEIQVDPILGRLRFWHVLEEEARTTTVGIAAGGNIAEGVMPLIHDDIIGL